jgi:CBS domain-containing protein
MDSPLIFIVNHAADERQQMERDLSDRFASHYRVAAAASGEAALSALAAHRAAQQTVALLLVSQALPGMSGTDFLAQAAPEFPHARKVLLAAARDTEAAITGINQLGIHHYLVQPWQPAAGLPVLDELLNDWRAAVELPYRLVQGIMETRVARIRADANLHQAAEIVAMSGVSDLMVMDHAGRFVGVLSEGDILRAALPDFDEIVEEGGTLAEAYQVFLRKGRALSEKPITPLIIREPITLHPDDHVAKAAAVLIGKQIRRLPVVREGRLLGTVSRANICEAVVGMF